MIKQASCTLAVIFSIAFIAGVNAQEPGKHCDKCAKEGKTFAGKGFFGKRGERNDRFAKAMKERKDKIYEEVKKTDAAFAQELDKLEAEKGETKRLLMKVYMTLGKAVEFERPQMPFGEGGPDRKGPDFKGGKEHKNCDGECKKHDGNNKGRHGGMRHIGPMGEEAGAFKRQMPRPTMKEAIEEAKLDIKMSQNIQQYKAATDPKEKEAVLKEIRKNLETKFDIGAKEESKRIESAEKRLKDIKDTSKKRKGDKNKIVEEKLAEIKARAEKADKKEAK